MISRMRNIVQHNLPAKILALVIAVILWGYVMNDQNPSIESTYTVQLDVVNAPEGYKITKDAASVKLRVRGPRLLFVSASESDFKAYVDLSKVEEGKHAVKVQTVLPQGFELVEAKPDMVTFTLDRSVQKTMKAEFIVTGSTAPGTTVAHIEPSVETVTIEGAASDIKEVTRVIGYVGLAGNGDDFSLKVPLTAINADGREVAGVTVKPASAEVSVQLARGLMKKIVTVKPVLGDGLATMFSASCGGTGVTTYGENIGVMAATRVYSTLLFPVAACFAIILGFSPKFGAVIQTIPQPILGGTSIVVFGLIAVAGARVWVVNHVDFGDNRNLIVAAVTLILGGGDFTIHLGSFTLGGIGTATFGAIILNALMEFGERRVSGTIEEEPHEANLDAQADKQ